MSQMQNDLVEEAAGQKSLMQLSHTRSGQSQTRPFFTLPREIRIMILDHAFGNGVLEIDLICDSNGPSDGTDATWRADNGDEVSILHGWKLISNLQRDGHCRPLGALNWMVTCRQG